MIDRSQVNAVATWLSAQIATVEAQIKRKDDEQRSSTPLVNEALYVAINILVVATLVGLLTAIWIFIPRDVSFSEYTASARVLLTIPILAYVIASLRMIDTIEVAGADFFGTPVHQFDNGLKWVPFGIFRLTRESSVFVQAEFPGDADKIQWTDEETALLPGKVRPLFILAAENPNGILPTERQMTIGVSFLVKIRLVRSRFFDLVRNISPIDPVTGLELLESNTGGTEVTPRMLEVLRHLRDTGSAFVNEIVAQLSYNELTQHLEQVNQLLMLRFKLEILAWGVDLEETKFTKINPGHSFNIAIQDRGRAVAERDATAIRAAGERTRLTEEGAGRAAAERELLLAQAAGEQARLEAVGKGYQTIRGRNKKLTAQEVAATETAKALATGPNNVVVTEGGVSGLAGTVLAAVKTGQNKGE